jgi:hypothetical protein
MREWKQAGRDRYIGVTTSSANQYADLEQVMARETLDFVQLNYSLDNRAAASACCRSPPIVAWQCINLPFGAAISSPGRRSRARIGPLNSIARVGASSSSSTSSPIRRDRRDPGDAEGKPCHGQFRRRAVAWRMRRCASARSSSLTASVSEPVPLRNVSGGIRRLVYSPHVAVAE